MPQENKKRGRRMNKRKHTEDEDPVVEEEASKRHKSQDGEPQEAEFLPLQTQDESLDHAYPPMERAFFGMLDEEEQEYFKRADEMLELNSFGAPDERELFLANVYKEAEGKELKIAQSQSCSRLMERLIQLSTSAQLKQLFQAFNGNFIHLVSHRFASHCCEALFLRAAPAVTQELLAPTPQQDAASADTIYVSMENLFLHTLAELEGSVGFLMTDQYASHVLRVLLLVLAGEPIDQDSTKTLLQSRRKEGVTVQGSDSAQTAEKSRTVPQSFSEGLKQLIAESVAGLDTDKLRALATHPNANPTLQLLLKLELTHFGKQRGKDETSIVRKLLPDDPITAENGSGSFINGLVYDAVGSHLVEQIVRYAPAKMFKSLNKQYFKEKLASLSRNEVAGYVVCRVLERMGKDDLYEAHEAIIPTVPSLLERNRTLVVRTLIERCAIRDVDTQAIAAQIASTFRGTDVFNIRGFLKFESKPETNDENRETPHDSVQSGADDQASEFSTNQSTKVHFNLLAQAMLLVPGALSGLILDSIVALEQDALVQMAKDPIVSRTVQVALTTKNASIIERRKLVQRFFGCIGDMSIDKAASHVVDCIWEGTHGLAFIRERIAEELAENEATLRDSSHGRAVWKNWKMDLYKRKRHEWVRQSKIKASNHGFQSFSELEQNKEEGGQRGGARGGGGGGGGGEAGKTPLQLARERHAAKRAGRGGSGAGRGGGRPGSRHATGANGEGATAATAST
ncbi:PLP-dependent transferase [Hortaea werneckii]|nr:PLP-dependent transferase [Hortaea werneckii]